MLPALVVLLACATCAYLSLASRDRRAFLQTVRVCPYAALCVAGMAAVALGVGGILFASTMAGCALVTCGLGAMLFAEKATR